MDAIIVTFLLNYLRKGETPLQNENRLNTIALNRCFRISSYSHDGFDTHSSEVMSQTGALVVGENIAFNLPIAHALVQMEDSPSHYANTHGPYQAVGVGICNKPVFNCTVPVGGLSCPAYNVNVMVLLFTGK